MLSVLVVFAILKKNFVGLCRCLPSDYMATIEKLKRNASVPDDLGLHLAGLPSTDTRNRTILALIIGAVHSDIEVLGICDLLENVVDNGTSKKFIHNLRSGKVYLVRDLSSINAVLRIAEVIATYVHIA